LQYLPSDFQESEPQLLDLHGCKLSLCKGLSEPEHQPVGSHVKKETKLVGKEPMAAQTVSLQAVFELIDPYLTGPS
jgi:hypothetical protein